ncbi:hypothetical protein I7I51_08109 [Histoplasma capsulatum]|uniref:Uncharacterized protein n=1 Tax=Ajellomyces capsulatus TaxID=5037 RepID=A0A8A1LZR4_AJECA|nr:hypothetical protein I7I51_08109 [Histoplasma capsulatum]
MAGEPPRPTSAQKILEQIQLREVAIYDATRVAEGTQDGHLLSQIEKEKKELADLYRDAQKYRNDLEKARKRCGQLKLMLESGLRELRPRFVGAPKAFISIIMKSS